MAANPINKPIVSSAPVKRPRSVSYESDTSISSATNYNSDSNSDSNASISSFNTTLSRRLSFDSGISNCSDARPRKKRRKRYKLNPSTKAYYYRYLRHARDISQLGNYRINLSKEVTDKAPYISYIIKKI